MSEAPDLRGLVTGLAQLARTRPDAALAEAESLLARHPRLVPVRCLAGRLARLSGDLQRAGAHLAAALAEDPGAGPAIGEMAALASTRGDFASAANWYRRLVETGNRHPDAWFNLALAEEQRGDFEAAARAYREALSAGAGDAPEIHARLGGVLAAVGDESAARDEFEAALREDEHCIEALLGTGIADVSAGRFDEALARFRQCVELKPDCAEAWKQILESRKLTDPADPDLAAARTLFEDPGLPGQGRESIGFALGKACDDLGLYDDAFGYYQQANDLKRRRLPAFDRETLARQTEELLEASETPTGRLRRRKVTVTPVFIVGMPRSGTTLVDQIITAHPDAAGVGELPFLDGAPGDDEAEQRAAYLERLGGAGARVVTNKYPANLRHLRRIRRLLPEARVIHVTRDPRDTCLSIYFQDFPVGNLYANDLGDIAAYYRSYRALADAWAGRGSGVLEVRYEAILEDFENVTHRLLAYCGLRWDPDCLDFAANPRPVTTLSRWQVRQPISTRSVGRWRRYREHLGPLFEGLGIAAD